MKFDFTEWCINDLITKYYDGDIELNPPYQRNDIWSLPAKQRLIDTIKKGYPLPTFFLYKKENGKYDMVDGQQRTRALLGYSKGLFTDLDTRKIDEIDKTYFYNEYKLPCIIISEVNPSIGESMEEFYYRVNKFGTKLNRPEILKAQYFDSPFQNLIEKIASSDEFQKLSLFTESSLSRMLDYDFIGELVALLVYEITDKKIYVDRLYENTEFDETKLKELEIKFMEILLHFLRFNDIYELKQTRYKQKNDFYSFFNFIRENPNLSNSTFDYFYKILVLIGPSIYPTNEKCFALQNYAFNCISQSNSKNARQERAKFLNDLLLNKDENILSQKETDDTINTILDIVEFFKLEKISLRKIQDYYVIPIEELNNGVDEKIDFK